MAQQQQPDDSLLREIDDALRHDKLMDLWRRFRAPILAAAIALVVATAGHGIWQNYQEKQGGIALEKLTSAELLYGQGKYAEAEAAFAALAKESHGNVRDMALLWQGRAIEQQEPARAVSVLAELANHPSGSDAIWADLACLRLAGIDEARASCLGNPQASPMKPERDFLRAARLWKEGDVVQARITLKKIADNAQLPETLRGRARDFLAVMPEEKKTEGASK